MCAICTCSKKFTAPLVIGSFVGTVDRDEQASTHLDGTRTMVIGNDALGVSVEASPEYGGPSSLSTHTSIFRWWGRDMYKPAFLLDLSTEPRAGSVRVSKLLQTNDRNFLCFGGIKDFVNPGCS